MIPQVVSIRMAYTDAVLSLARLNMTRKTCLPSLKLQTVPFILHLRLNDSDPYLNERLELFKDFNVTRSGFPYDVLMTRMDDDDWIAPDFLERVGNKGITEGWWSFPEGYLRMHNGHLWRRRYPSNQFQTRYCKPGMSVYQMNHTKTRPDFIDDEPAWVWIQHDDAQTKTRTVPSQCYARVKPPVLQFNGVT